MLQTRERKKIQNQANMETNRFEGWFPPRSNWKWRLLKGLLHQLHQRDIKASNMLSLLNVSMFLWTYTFQQTCWHNSNTTDAFDTVPSQNGSSEYKAHNPTFHYCCCTGAVTAQLICSTYMHITLREILYDKHPLQPHNHSVRGIVLKGMEDMGAKLSRRHPSSRVKTQWHETPLGWGQSVLIEVGQPTLAYHSRCTQCSKVTIYRVLCMNSSSEAFTCEKEIFLQDGSWFSVGL